MTIKKVKCDEKGTDIFTNAVRNGKVVVFPTDTVYGIGGDPYNEETINRIYKIKNRDLKKPMPILADNIKRLERIVKFDKSTLMLARKFWPGKITMILENQDERLGKLSHNGKIGVRIPNNKCLLKMLGNLGLIIGTSANFSEQKPFINPDECLEKFAGYDILLDGGVLKEMAESTVVEITDERVIIHREGAITKKEILDLF
ncbi:MAG: L-threonylcarbamoyladenylate synthase [Candidatus Nitrosoabyssus spongiisocia]|nr:MAG: L-threonylcarbamoyladenylate synthase [Nitrosopumilaceae archaeon AB1(1)]